MHQRSDRMLSIGQCGSFSHNNYPAQFRRLIPVLVDAGHEVVFFVAARNGTLQK